jgi:hypothetical protein
MKRQLPSRPNLDQLKHQARELLNGHKAGDKEAIRRIRESHPRLARLAEAGVRSARFTLSGAQLVIAREYGFVSWPQLKDHVEKTTSQTIDPLEELKQAFRSDQADVVGQMLERHPELKARINEPIGPFDTPAIVAARNNETAVVRALLKAGLPVDARSQHNATVLHWAAFHGNCEMVNAILPFGPPLEATDSDFNGTPLGWAIYGSENGWHSQTGDYAETIEALIQAGAHLPEQLAGSEVVRQVLRRHGVKEESI